MEEIVIQAEQRQVIGKQVNSLRRAGKLPAVIYGRHIDPIAVTLDLKEASRILDRLSPSTLVVIELNGKRHYTLVREKQRNPLLGSLRHVDFQAVSLTEKTRAQLPVHLVGESPAVETYYGILVQRIEQIEVEGLPRDLPERIDVDISTLKEIGDAIFVRDLQMPAGVEGHEDPDEIIVVVTAPEAEEVLEEEEAVEEEPEPEVIEKGKREEGEEEG
jgi:large subunit ribosomal protein L25